MRTLVTNTTPLIALTAATGGLDVLRHLYGRVIVPLEVQQELLSAGPNAMGASAFKQARWLDCQTQPATLSSYLSNTLDRGEAAVIQTALNLDIPLVCIDEAVGRRVARLSGLTLTGSVGILIKAQQTGFNVSIQQAIERMREHGIWLNENLISFALGNKH
jgi:predicted nucleic acid-binding protein